MVTQKKLVWDKEALFQLEEIYQYIYERSPQAADKVRKTIRNATRDLLYNPGIYQLDRLRKNNDGSIRAFEKYSYRITYQVKES
jgi:plasmid stabilization system protein ParE